MLAVRNLQVTKKKTGGGLTMKTLENILSLADGAEGSKVCIIDSHSFLGRVVKDVPRNPQHVRMVYTWVVYRCCRCTRFFRPLHSPTLRTVFHCPCSLLRVKRGFCRSPHSPYRDACRARVAAVFTLISYWIVWSLQSHTRSAMLQIIAHCARTGRIVAPCSVVKRTPLHIVLSTLPTTSGP